MKTERAREGSNADLVEDLTIPTPAPDADVEIDDRNALCGYPIDRTGSDWPGEPSDVYEAGVTA